jgi:RNA 3'-terminal phosphate cyclase (ATP)
MDSSGIGNGGNIVRIDGSYGEGGGQILRTSLALSCVLVRPFEIVNIRKNRRNPGLQPQHLTAVAAAAIISRAEVAGAELASTRLSFDPRAVPGGGEYLFDVGERKGSAGSTSLVLQTILLPLARAQQASRVTVIGGTHVPWSPPFHYLQKVFLPLLARLGVSGEIEIKRWGWYPRGGGKVTARLQPSPVLLPVSLMHRGRLVRITGISAESNLPRDIAVRQQQRALKRLLARGIDARIDLVDAPSTGRGTFILLLAEFENIVVGFGSLGEIGKRAEKVADEACDELFAYADTNGVLDPYLSDQIIPWLALAGGRSSLAISRITRHLLTNLWIVQQFLDLDILVEGREGTPGSIRIGPSSRGTHREGM